VVFMNLRANSDYFATQQKQISFYNRDGVCLFRGVNWIFKQHSGSFLSGRSDRLTDRQSSRHDLMFSVFNRLIHLKPFRYFVLQKMDRSNDWTG
jgi:hypothetical protein